MNPQNQSPFSIGDCIKWMRATTEMQSELQASPAGDVWWDSRKVKPGDLFFALKTDRDDGHNYIPAAFAAGAVAAVVENEYWQKCSHKERNRLIGVTDPLLALQEMAMRYRESLKVPVIAVTGSSGKTTTRLFISTVLQSAGIIGAPAGNWNNHIGVPASILRLRGNEKAAVLEFGANHEGEIRILTRIAKPDFGIITNIGYAHIGYFGTLGVTTRVKFEIMEGIDPATGHLLLNGDDMRLVKAGNKCSIKPVFYGFKRGCDLRATDFSVTMDNRTLFTIGKERYELPMPGIHFVCCALPAIWLARRFDLTYKQIREALLQLKPDPMRGTILDKNGITFIVDCYNANPSSMRAGIELLMSVSRKGRACAIVGDMKELGSWSKRFHRELGRILVKKGVELIIAVGEYANEISYGTKQAGMDNANVFPVNDASVALEVAKNILHNGDTVLLKGSRAVALETVIRDF